MCSDILKKNYCPFSYNSNLESNSSNTYDIKVESQISILSKKKKRKKHI